ncbi:MAG: integration host factor subunit alpha [Syntrophales bacterium]
MKKTDIINMLATELNMSRKEATMALESALEIIKEELTQGREVMISGFGKWQVRTKKPRRGRNPKTGETITIRGRKVISFKISQKLKKDLQSLDAQE